MTLAPDREQYGRWLAEEQRKFTRFFKGLLLFMLGWPLLLVAILSIGWLLFQRPGAIELAAVTIILDAGIALAFGYLLGFVPAAIIGAVISWLQVEFRALNAVHVLLIALVLGVCSWVLQFDKDDYATLAEQLIDMSIRFTAVFVATFACWAMIRRWRTRDGAMAAAAGAPTPAKEPG
jgi:hypothetical protein